MTSQPRQFKLNLPPEIDQWVQQAAERSLRSKSAEIIFLLRERMEKEKAGPPTTA